MYGDIQHIFFDLDRTLWDFERNSSETLAELFEELKLVEAGISSHEDFINAYIVKNEHCWELYRTNQITKADLRTLRFQLAFDEFGVDNKELVQILGDEYVNRSPRKTALFPNTVETLEYLSQRYTLHIITNGFEEVQYTKMETSGIHSYFKHVTTSEKAGCKKPDERIFHYAMAVGNASAYNSLMIGDDEHIDVRGAENVGMKAILFQPDEAKVYDAGTSVIRNLNELFRLL